MNKIVCERCGLVNLEKFVTFPHCAACGARLPQAPRAPLLWWRRPVRAPLWAGVIGLCCTALGALGLVITHETRRLEEKILVVYTTLPRQMDLGQNAIVQLLLDTVESDSRASTRPFEAVRLRVSRQTFRDFQMISISPPPSSRSMAGSGRYYMWQQLPRAQPIRLLVRPRQSGPQRRLHLMLFVRDFTPIELRRTVAITRRQTRRVPNSHQEKNHVQRRR